jgi:hypothetical protein
MRLKLFKSRRQQASALTVVVVMGAILSLAAGSMMLLSKNSLYNAMRRRDWNRAFFQAESAMVWAVQSNLDKIIPAGGSNFYSTASGTLPAAVLRSAANPDTGFRGAWVSVYQPTNSGTNVIIVTASARMNEAVRTLQARVTLRPVSEVFDFEYFLNNWGWWWGSSITGNGPQRANWDFDFKGSPTVNGAIYATDYIEENGVPCTNLGAGVPFGGLAATKSMDLVHSGAPRVTMPNLLNFTNYQTTAQANTASNGIWCGGTQIVAGVHSNATKPGLYLAGTSASPIVVKGTVVIPGDVVIKGNVTGQGTLYVGGHLYIADNVNYVNGPNLATSPETMTDSARDAWVASSKTNDLVAFAVRGSIYGGDVTHSDWVSSCYNYAGSGLAHVGDESQLGMDGIADTPDDGVPYLHADGTTSAWYDADGDGTVNGNYNYSTDINMTTARAKKISGYPTDSGGNPVAYKNVATINMGTVNGVYYTDHAVAMRLTQSAVSFFGALICRNEQIMYQNKLTFSYDSRIHSRYRKDPNQIINLGLPSGKPMKVDLFTELAADASNL